MKKTKKIKTNNLFGIKPVKMKPMVGLPRPRLKPQPAKSKMKNLIFGYDRPKPARRVTGKLAMNWTQAKRRFPKLSPFGDADRDGVKNWLDCRPFDKTRQDFKYKGKTYPDTVLTKKHYRPKSVRKFKDVSKENLSIEKKDLDKSTAYYDTLDKIMPGTMDYLKKSKTVVAMGDQNSITRAAAYIPQSKESKRGILLITPPETEFYGNVAKDWSNEKQAEFQVKDEIKNVAHEMGHLKRDIEMGKKGVPAGKRFEKGGWENKKYFQKKKTDEGYEIDMVTADAEGYEEEAVKHENRILKRIDSTGESMRDLLSEEINKKQKDEVDNIQEGDLDSNDDDEEVVKLDDESKEDKE